MNSPPKEKTRRPTAARMLALAPTGASCSLRQPPLPGRIDSTPRRWVLTSLRPWNTQMRPRRTTALKCSRLACREGARRHLRGNTVVSR
jgi:hypothetical protein